MTTAHPLSIPLHFASSSSGSWGPIIPKDWRQKWHRSDCARPKKNRACNPDDEEDWPDDDLHKWVTCMTSWKEQGRDDEERLASTPSISIGDETGLNIDDINSSKQDPSYSTMKKIGAVQGGIRIAIGTQNGIIWIFKEKKNNYPVISLPEFSSNARSPSGSSLISELIKSPLQAGLSHTVHHHEMDGLSSPTQAVASTSDVNALASVTMNSGTVDAEESLETQWHAGRENHSVVGGVMEALGLNHTNAHHAHSHGHQSHTSSENHSGTSTPSSHNRRASRAIRKDSRSSAINLTPSTGTPPVAIGRSRTVSVATTMTDSSERATVLEGEGGQKHRLSNLMSPTMQKKSSRASQETKESKDGQGNHGNVKRKVEKSAVEEVESTLVFQSPTPSPIISLIEVAGTCLASLQQDGTFIMWSLQHATQLQNINIRTAKATFLEESVTALPANPALSNPTTSLSAFAALRSGANSPAPRSRANSNTTQPNKAVLDNVYWQGISRMHSMKIVHGHSDTIHDPLLLCYDDVKHRVSIVDAVHGNVLAIKVLSDCSGTSLAAHFTAEGDCVELLYINNKNNIQIRMVRIAAAKGLPHPVESHKHNHLSSASAFLRREGLSNTNSRAPSIAEERTDHQELGKGGLEGSLEGLEFVNENLLLTWTDDGLHLLRRIGESLFVAESVKITSPISVQVDDRSVLVETKTDTLFYQINQEVSLTPISQFPLAANNVIQGVLISDGDMIRCCLSDDDKLIVECNERTILQITSQVVANRSKITASLPFTMERIVISLSSGHLVLCSLSDLVSGNIPEPDETMARHKGHVTILRLVVNPRTQARHIVGGTEEGDVIFWDATTLKKQSERSLLACPIIGMLVLGKDDNTLRLNGCLACIGADGSLVTFLLDGLNDLYTIPGRGVSLEELAVRADELLLIYEDSRARVWDMRTLELRRSIGQDQATALLDDGKGWWTRFSMSVFKLETEHGSAGVLSSIATSRDITAGTMLANLRRAIEAASRMVLPLKSSIQTQQQDEGEENTDSTGVVDEKLNEKRAATVSINSNNGKKAVNTLRSLMHSLMPLGLDTDGDAFAAKLLELSKPCPTSWIRSGTFSSSTGHLALVVQSDLASSILSLSKVITTARLLGLTAMLLITSKITELRSFSIELLTMLDSIEGLVGDGFQSPCLAMLTNYILDSVMELQQAAQTLFTTTLDAMSQEQIDTLCQEWSRHLPSRGEQKEEKANKAVLLLGLISIEKFTMLPPVLLKEVANSIALYVKDDALPTQQTTAIILCDRGFTIFQHYFDAMNVVRALFSLSTSKSQEQKENVSATVLENRALARRATLRIAEDNTPLFMTTLSLDILHAQSPAHCDATMRLVALMVRKRPLILYPNLPRLAEAVVKSLDPTDTSMRSVIHRSATIIISELIATYPTIAFHKELQRLAVGTFEGAIIMYDLKTSTRLYVIEAHHGSLSGLSFSQDGRRLISICLRDTKVKVWKTGVGFSSFLSFGGAPRQGNLLSVSSNGGTSSSTPHSALPSSTMGKTESHQGAAASTNGGGTDAYKTFEFGRISEEDPAKEADNLKLISFDWVGPRNIKVGVGETCISFDAR